MPTPYGRARSSDIYYQFGGSPPTFVANWLGMPQIAGGGGNGRAAESSALGADYLDISASYHKDLGSHNSHDETPTYKVSVGHKSVLHSGPEQSQLNDAVRLGLGAVGGLSVNERRLLVVAGAGIAAWWYLRKRR